MALEHREHARAGQCATQRNARRQRLDDVPAHRAALVVRAQAGQAGEGDHGHAGGNGHFDARVGSHAALGQDHGHKGRNHHAPTDAQQTGHESGAQAQGREFSNQLRLKHGMAYGVGGEGCGAGKVSAETTGPGILNRSLGGRGQHPIGFI